MVEASRLVPQEIQSQNGSIYVLTGLERSGKTTQGIKLAAKLQIPYISTGDMIRAKAASNDEGALKDACVKVVEKDVYLPANYLADLLVKRLLETDTSGGAVIDGGLRTLEETERFDEILADGGKGSDNVHVIYLRIPQWLGVERSLAESRYNETFDGLLNRYREFYTNLAERMKIAQGRYNFIKILQGPNSLSKEESESQVHAEIMHKLNI